MNQASYAFPSYPGLSLDLGVRSDLMWLFLAVGVVVFIIASAILLYHWRKYGMGNKNILLAEIVYLVGAGFIFSMAIISILRV